MQGGFRLCPKRQHLQSGVELTQLLLQAGVGVGGEPGIGSEWSCALCPFCLPQSPRPRRGVTNGLAMALNLFRLTDSLENLLKVKHPRPRKMPICQSFEGPFNIKGFNDLLNLQVENLRSRVAGGEGTRIDCLLLTFCWDPSQQVCPRVTLPGCQRVVGHISKVQKWEEVLGANHAKALREVRVHSV